MLEAARYTTRATRAYEGLDDVQLDELVSRRGWRKIERDDGQERTYRSDVLRSAHLIAQDLHAIGSIDKATMREFGTCQAPRGVIKEAGERYGCIRTCRLEAEM